jgi:very-short-patch-repair endonuclease
VVRPMVARVTAQIIEGRGWRLGTSLENKVAHWLSRFRYRPADVAQQHRVGKYRLDFAWPTIKVALEADGWHHRAPEGAARDAARDMWLRSEGWLVFRVHDEPGNEDVLGEQVARVSQVVIALGERQGRR